MRVPANSENGTRIGSAEELCVLGEEALTSALTGSRGRPSRYRLPEVHRTSGTYVDRFSARTQTVNSLQSDDGLSLLAWIEWQANF